MGGAGARGRGQGRACRAEGAPHGDEPPVLLTVLTVLVVLVVLMALPPLPPCTEPLPTGGPPYRSPIPALAPLRLGEVQGGRRGTTVIESLSGSMKSSA